MREKVCERRMVYEAMPFVRFFFFALLLQRCPSLCQCVRLRVSFVCLFISCSITCVRLKKLGLKSDI